MVRKLYPYTLGDRIVLHDDGEGDGMPYA